MRKRLFGRLLATVMAIALVVSGTLLTVSATNGAAKISGKVRGDFAYANQYTVTGRTSVYTGTTNGCNLTLYMEMWYSLSGATRYTQSGTEAEDNVSSMKRSLGCEKQAGGARAHSIHTVTFLSKTDRVNIDIDR